MNTKFEKLQETIEKFEKEIELEREVLAAGETVSRRQTGFTPWADAR